MSVRYLVPCSCGQSVPVSASQAGGRTTCECGATIEVPRLRDLRELPTEGPAEASGGGWSFRLGVTSLFLVIAAGLAAGAGWLAATEPAPPAPFDAEARNERVAIGLEQIPPADLFNMFVNIYQPLAQSGMSVAESPQNEATRAVIAQSQWTRNWLLTGAGVALGVGILLFALIKD